MPHYIALIKTMTQTIFTFITNLSQRHQNISLNTNIISTFITNSLHRHRSLIEYKHHNSYLHLLPKHQNISLNTNQVNSNVHIFQKLSSNYTMNKHVTNLKIKSLKEILMI